MPAKHDHANLGGSNRLLSVESAAALLDMPVRRLRDNRARWGIPSIRVGREVRIRERDLVAWIDRQSDVQAAS